MVPPKKCVDGGCRPYLFSAWPVKALGRSAKPLRSRRCGSKPRDCLYYALPASVPPDSAVLHPGYGLRTSDQAHEAGEP